jgi:hypothetical protein
MYTHSIYSVASRFLYFMTVSLQKVGAYRQNFRQIQIPPPISKRRYYLYIYIYILCGFKTSDDAFRISYSIAFDCSIRPFLDLFHSWLYTFHLSRFSGGRPRFFSPSGFQWIIIFGSRVGSILSTWPYQISCFQGYVIQYHIAKFINYLNNNKIKYSSRSLW